MAEGFFIKRLGTLRPADADAEEILRGVPDGTTVRADVKWRGRSLQHHRLFWALMTKVHENLPDEKRERYPSVGLLVAWFKIATGHCDTFIVEGKGTAYIPKSIRFSKMDADQFNEFWNRCCDLIAKHFVPGVTSKEWQREVAEMIGIGALVEPAA
jgi:hypothetical protein